MNKTGQFRTKPDQYRQKLSKMSQYLTEMRQTASILDTDAPYLRQFAAIRWAGTAKIPADTGIDNVSLLPTLRVGVFSFT